MVQSPIQSKKQGNKKICGAGDGVFMNGGGGGRTKFEKGGGVGNVGGSS